MRDKYAKKNHKATGKPRGRPKSLPDDLNERILAALEKRIDPETGLALPDWKGLITELGVSRSTLIRRFRALHDEGLVENVSVPDKIGLMAIRYRLKRLSLA